MTNYKGILFKMNKDGAAVTNSSTYGCYVTASPYIPVPTKVKNITSQSWFDENGDDEYIPSTLYYEAMETELSFVYKGTVASAKTQILNFINYLRSGVFSFYDQYTQIGRQNVRLIDFSDDATMRRESPSSGNCVVEFSISIKINDPVTNITLTEDETN
jgi:hypothetical protein